MGKIMAEMTRIHTPSLPPRKLIGALVKTNKRPKGSINVPSQPMRPQGPRPKSPPRPTSSRCTRGQRPEPQTLPPSPPSSDAGSFKTKSAQNKAKLFALTDSEDSDFEVIKTPNKLTQLLDPKISKNSDPFCKARLNKTSELIWPGLKCEAKIIEKYDSNFKTLYVNKYSKKPDSSLEGIRILNPDRIKLPKSKIIHKHTDLNELSLIQDNIISKKKYTNLFPLQTNLSMTSHSTSSSSHSVSGVFIVLVPGPVPTATFAITSAYSIAVFHSRPYSILELT